MGILKKTLLWTICIGYFFIPWTVEGLPMKMSENWKSVQVRSITGRVVNESDQPIPNVTVVEQEGTNTTQTDNNGEFILKLPENAKAIRLHVLGYEQQIIQLSNATHYTVTLKEEIDVLEEVVVVGYGQQKKVNLTGAVGIVDKQALENRPVQNVAQALQGVVPGLNIDNQNGGALDKRSNLNIRGIATIGAGSNGGALILVDGMEADIKTVNPQDIESISVLKDAAASSIYGSRAPFGVILITTKKGKTGRASINYNNSFRLSSPMALPKMADSYSFVNYFNEASRNAGWGDRFEASRVERIRKYISGEIMETTIPNSGNPSLWGDGYDYGNDNVNYYKEVFSNNALSQDHNLSASGGGETVTYYLSSNYFDQDGLLNYGKDTYNRYTLTGKVNADLTKYLSVGYNARFVRENFARPTHLSDGLFWDLARQAWPTKPLYDPNGFLFDDHILNMQDGGRANHEQDWVYQQLQVSITPKEGWQIKADLNYRTENYFFHADRQTVYQTAVDGVSRGLSWNDNTWVNESASKSNYYNINLYSDYEAQVDLHYLKFMAGFQSEGYFWRDLNGTRNGIMVSTVPTLNTSSGLGADGSSIPPSLSGGYADWSTAGYFGRINYNYDEKYLLEANVRYDGTSRFRSNRRWGFFPSFSAGWNIDREIFFGDAKEIFQNLKLRASYGKLGNQNTNDYYPTYTSMGIGVNAGPWLINQEKPTISWSPGLISTSLTWEDIVSYNIGLDLSALRSRLSFTADFFVRDTRNMVGPAPELPATLGTPVPVTNNTDLRTKGFELELQWRDRTESGFGYSARAMLSDSRTTILNYSNPTNSLDRYRKGQDIGEIWGYTTKGIARTNEEMQTHLASLNNGGQRSLGDYWEAGDIMYEDTNGDGKIDWGESTADNPGDLRIIGNSLPRYNLGLDLSANWKGFDARVFFQGILKRDIFQGSYYFWGINGSQGPWFSTVFEEHLDYFRNDPENPMGVNIDSYYPRALFGTAKNQQTQTRYLQNAAYLRLKNAQIGYTLPNTIFGKSNIKNLRISVAGENLLTMTKLSRIFDPETIFSPTGGTIYPLARTWSFGLSCNF